MTRAAPPGSAEHIGECASRWVASLGTRQRDVAVWPFDSPQRGDWYYAPRERAGVALQGMDLAQREKAWALVDATLTAQGASKARAITALEDVLADLEQGRRTDRNPLDYAVTVFGNPGDVPWGWRLEGHHLVLNVTVAAGGTAVTPTFWGANPARVTRGERRGRRVLAGEYLRGLELARSLTRTQREHAVVGERSVGNVVTVRGRARALRHPTGLACDELTAQQSAVLEALLGEYTGNIRDGLSPVSVDDVLRDPSTLRLAWAGGMAEGEPFYYRVHGPRLLVELDCTQDDANHIHSVWRDPANDWGRDVLGEHYRHHHDDD